MPPPRTEIPDLWDGFHGGEIRGDVDGVARYLEVFEDFTAGADDGLIADVAVEMQDHSPIRTEQVRDADHGDAAVGIDADRPRVSGESTRRACTSRPC